MSKTMKDIEQAMNLRADFDEFLAAGDEENARAAVDAMGEKGEELEALKMHQECNRVFNHEPKDPWIAEQDRGHDIDSHIYAQADY